MKGELQLRSDVF